MSPVPDRTTPTVESGPVPGTTGAAVVRAVGRWLQAWGRQGIEFLYPPACRLCGEELSPQVGIQRDSGFCPNCLNQLLEDNAAGCERCGAPVGPYAATIHGCRHCHGDQFAFETVLRLGTYKGAVKSAVIEAKKRGAEGLVAGLADLVWRRNESAFRQAAPALVIPVPHNLRQAIFRPHNPAAILAEAWAERLNCPWHRRGLVKSRWTAAQARLRPQERRENLKGVFTVRPGIVPPGSTVLLADDVLTTGSTAHEAALALVQAGAARVVVAVVARGLGKDQA